MCKFLAASLRLDDLIIKNRSKNKALGCDFHLNDDDVIGWLVRKNRLY